jgi:hypothetical protein
MACILHAEVGFNTYCLIHNNITVHTSA